MTETLRTVAHYVDGTILKGTTQDFSPLRPMFHVLPAAGGTAVVVPTKKLKALFVVKTFEGNKTRRDLAGFIAAPSETAHGKKIAVHFKDGELLCGYTLSFTPDREGFFLFPSDPSSNNLRVYVVTAATKEVKAGPAAEALVQRVMDSRAS
jgi:hypothetical protein